MVVDFRLFVRIGQLWNVNHFYDIFLAASAKIKINETRNRQLEILMKNYKTRGGVQVTADYGQDVRQKAAEWTSLETVY